MSDFEVMGNKISRGRESGGLTGCMREIRIYGSQKKEKERKTFPSVILVRVCESDVV